MHIPSNIHISLINGHNYWLAPLLGVAGLIFGALFTGAISLYIEHYRHVKKKLATAYAFKGEISALLDIIEKRNFIGMLENFIKTADSAREKLNEFYVVGNPEALRKQIIGELGTNYLKRFVFTVNEDTFYVKKSLKDSIGLIEESAEPVIKFYNIANALILDVEENRKFNEFVDSKFWIGTRGQIIDNLYNFAIDFNALFYVDANEIIHKSILEITKALMDFGKESIEQLDKLIKNNNGKKQSDDKTKSGLQEEVVKLTYASNPAMNRKRKKHLARKPNQKGR